ncbi:hypothetical protein BYT27DRAFT_7074995 [Phlegmacium glaucopus]|nr:hypothetical protein BYT27DRAFT_7074995 [Phlegmacium glaucopus]
MFKRVRFASQSTVYPPETSISPIAISFSSPTSCSRSSTLSPYSPKTNGLPSPTPYTFICNPRPRLLEPVKYAGRHGCHPLLEPSVMTYDLRDRVSTATTTRNNHSLSIETLHESAFSPSRLYVTIISSYLPWTIKVYASNGSYITLQDILTSVYSDLRTNITPSEFQLLPSQHYRNRATRAYEQRYRRLRRQLSSERGYHKSSESEKRAGMKRVDFLMSHTKFLGIRWQCGDEWKLHVASPTREL